MGIEKSEAEGARRKAVKEAAFAKAKQVFDEYEGLIEEQKQLRMLVERECGAQVKASNEAVVDNNAEIVRLNTMLEKAKNKEIKLSFREKSEMSRQLKERRANQETLMYEAIDLQEEFKQSIQLINDKIKALRQEQGEKEDNGADEGGEEGLLKLFETRFAQNVFVGALQSVESYPAQGDDDEAAP